MNRRKLLIGLLAIIVGVLAIIFVLASEYAVVIHPKGIIAQRELEILGTMIALMLIIIVPTYIVLYRTAWKYRADNSDATHEPEEHHTVFGEVMLWVIPAIIVVFMGIVSWIATHELDPYKPLESETKPLKIQVLAIDWKWLFIYPEQGIATLNFVQLPERTPIHFELAADGSPMNSFWIPQLSGQIYAMTGMATELHIMANEPGEFTGKAVEINGEGYASMTFGVKSTSQSDFDAWIAEVKKSPERLTSTVYNDLVQPSVNSSVILYSDVDSDLFKKTLMKYANPNTKRQ